MMSNRTYPLNESAAGELAVKKRDYGSMMMRSPKRKRLEAKGWKVGDAKDFLGLSSQEEACIEIRLKLAESLRRQRLRRQMTQSGPGERNQVKPIPSRQNGSR